MKKFYDTVEAGNGSLLAGAQVRVLNKADDSLATIYSDSSGTPLANPVTTDSLGFFEFYVADGDYNLEYLYAGAVIKRLKDIPIYRQGPAGTVTPAPGQTVSTRTSLAAITSPAANQRADVANLSGIEGFYFVSGDQSANVTADPAKRTWVAPAAAPTGASGAWKLIFSSLLEAKAVAHVIDDIRLGTATQIDWYGDSTTWGALGTNTAVQSSLPSPAALQQLLRGYFNNTAATVNNKGISGNTALQCLEGSGVAAGAGTFETQILASTARIAFIDFAINDAEGASSTTAETFAATVSAMVDVCRANDKVPVLVTPFPCLNAGGNGSVQRAARTKQFSELVRHVAAQRGVTLYDKGALVEKLFATGKYRLADILPDGVHGLDFTYKAVGYGAGAVLVGQVQPLSRGNPFAPASLGTVQGTNLSGVASTSSRIGSSISTGLSGGDKLSMVLNVSEGALDLYAAYPIWFSGSTTPFAVNFDGTSVGSITMGNTNYNASGFIQDHEVLIAENVDPGIHLIQMTASDKAVALNYLRVRAKGSASERHNLNSATARDWKSITPELSFTSSAANGYEVFDEFPTPRLLRDVRLRFTANFAGLNEGLFINGAYFGLPTGSPSDRYGVVLHLTTSGYLAIGESTGPSTQTVTTLGAVDLRGVSHTYELWAKSHNDGSNPDQVIAYVDGAAVGSPFTLGQNLIGGFLGAWRQSAGTTTFSNVMLASS